MNLRTRPGMTSLIAGSLAIGLIVAGGVVFVDQLLHWAREREWHTVTLRLVVLDDVGNTRVPFMVGWLQQSHAAWYEMVFQLLDAIPLWTFLVLMGGIVAVKVGRIRS
jgi:hypothetical protein